MFCVYFNGLYKKETVFYFLSPNQEAVRNSAKTDFAVENIFTVILAYVHLILGKFSGLTSKYG